MKTRWILTLLIGSFFLAGDLFGSGFVTIRNEHLSVQLANTGAELQSIKHLTTETEYLWQGDPAIWARRAPNMFPVNVRFKDNHFLYKGKPYEMPGMGLAANADFVVREDSESAGRVVHVLESSEETLRHYPFPFRLEILSEVDGLQLIQRYTVSNTGDETLYFALGGHPGFRTPFIHGRGRGDYQIRFSKPMKIDRIKINKGVMSNVHIPLLDNEDRIALDDVRIANHGMFLLNHGCSQISISLKDQPPYITVDLEDFPNTNIWTPPPRPYVCIEPMVSHHDHEDAPEAIEDKEFLIALSPGESKTYQYRISVNPEEGLKALK